MRRAVPVGPNVPEHTRLFNMRLSEAFLGQEDTKWYMFQFVRRRLLTVCSYFGNNVYAGEDATVLEKDKNAWRVLLLYLVAANNLS